MTIKTGGLNQEMFHWGLIFIQNYLTVLLTIKEIVMPPQFPPPPKKKQVTSNYDFKQLKDIIRIQNELENQRIGWRKTS